MDRIILLALLGVPILIGIHVAMFAQGVSSAWSQDSVATLQGHWDAQELPLRFEVNSTQEQGS